MYERFTDRARKVMQLANQEAQRFNHEYIGTEHILIGLLKEGSGVAANVLKNLDLDLGKIRAEIEKRMKSEPLLQIAMGKLPHTPRTKRVVEFAVDEARLLNHNYVGTEHILLGLIREAETFPGEGKASQVLESLGVKLDETRQEIRTLLGIDGQKPGHAEPASLDAGEKGGAYAVRTFAEMYLRAYFGERCKDFEENCECCIRWAALDRLLKPL